MDIQILDFAKICRTCLGTDKRMRTLFPDDTDEVNEMEEIRKMIDDFIIYSVSNSDNLPNNICLKCIDQVRATYNFKNQCERSFELLSSIMETCNSGSKNETALVILDEVESAKDQKNDIFHNKEEDALEMIETNFNDDEFNCTYCAKSFSQEVHLRKHISILHANAGNTCNLCSKHCGSPTKLKKHISVCHSENSMNYLIKCANCAEEFESEEALGEHICGGDNSFDPTNVVEMLGLTESKKNIKQSASDDGNDDSNYAFNDEQSDDDNESGDDQLPLAKLFKTKTVQKKGNDSLEKTDTDDKQSKDETNSPSKRDHKCDICNKTFKRSSHLKRHKITHLEEKPFVCKVCNKGFSRADHLRIHQFHHEKIKPYVCSECNRGFFTSERLRRHMERNFCDKDKNPTPKTEFCSICNKGFTTAKYLAIHVRTHTDRKWNCKQCPETFNSKQDLAKHTKNHSTIDTEKPFLCSECGLRFVRNDYLIIHMRRHKGEKPYKCKFCGKGFPRATDLNVHERYHTGEKTHLCTVCGKGFHRAYNLLVHMRVHTGEKPYKCPHCSKSFAQGNDLKSHIRRHTGERFKCDICEEGFIQGYHLTQHKRNVHGIDTQSHIRRVEKFVTQTEQQQQVEVMRSQTKKTDVEMVEDYLQIEIKQEEEHNSM